MELMTLNMERQMQSCPLSECQYKWRYRKLYPGILEISPLSSKNPEILAEEPPPQKPPSSPASVATNLKTFLHNLPPRRKIKPVPSSKSVNVNAVPMDSFNKYQDSVRDAWSTEDPEDVSEKEGASSSRLTSHTENFNGFKSGKVLSNRYSSEHLRAKGLQRLALQSGPGLLTGRQQIRPGVAVRSVSMNFSANDQSHHPGDPVVRNLNSPAYHHTPPLDFLPRHMQKSEKFFKLLAERAIDLEDLRKLSWSGIPTELRARVWRLLCGYAPPLGDTGKLQESLQRKRDEYMSLVNEYYPKREDDQYKDTFHQIHIDVPRMCPLVPLFQQTLVQEIFERVLFIWALRNPASGYVQGINDLVTPYFIVFLRDYIPSKEPVEDYPIDNLYPKAIAEVEADSFWCLSKLLAGIQNNYTFAQPGIQQRVLQLKDLIQRVDGDLHRHLERCTVEYLQFSFRWMNNLLIRELPLNCIIRLWDSYHSELDGFACFHVYVCASFLLWWSGDLRQQPDFQHSLMLLQNLPTQNWGDDEVERLLAKAFMLKYAFADAPRHLKSS